MAEEKETKKTNVVVETAKSQAKGKVGSAVGSAAGKAAAVAINAIATAGNTVLPVISEIVGAVVSWVVANVVNKVIDFFDKHKEALLVPAAIGAGIIFGLPALTITGIIAGLLFWVIGVGVVITTIFGTIAFSFVTLVLMVTLILFIINSGAYIVPGSSLENGPYNIGGGTIHCVDTKGPMTLIPNNTIGTPIAYRAWQIVADLYQGFWCFWNRPPLNPPGNSNFPNDVTLYPPNYPSLFDVATFLSDPNIDPVVASQRWDILFWCTSLVWKSYSETVGWWPGSLSASGMENYFIAHHQYVPAAQATSSNIPPGSAVFFRVGGAGITGHVGVVYSLNSDDILFVQSNADVKEGSINFVRSGPGIINVIPYLEVTGFGTP